MGLETAARTRDRLGTSRHMGLRRSVPVILAAVMLMRAMIPVGFMPDLSAAGQGRFGIAICTGDGARTIPFDHDGGANPAHVPQHGNRGFDLCAFALAMAGTLIVLGLILGVFQFEPSRAFSPPPVKHIPFASGVGSLGPRAPPLP